MIAAELDIPAELTVVPTVMLDEEVMVDPDEMAALTYSPPLVPVMAAPLVMPDVVKMPPTLPVPPADIAPLTYLSRPSGSGW